VNRRSRPLRRAPRHAQRFEILVFTEGKVTEVEYLKDLERRHRDRTVITVDEFHGSPHSIVARAVAARKTDLEHERKKRGRSRDEYWCVFDCDEHPKLEDAFDLAEANSIHVAFSNPCVELWFVLHLQEQTGHIDRGAAQKVWHAATGSRSKHLDQATLELLTSHFALARSRAQALDRKHDLDGSPDRSNPSSTLWRLVQTVTDHR